MRARLHFAYEPNRWHTARMLAPMMLALASVASPECPSPDAWLAGDRSSRAVRNDTKRRVVRTARALGAKPEAIAVARAVTQRESHGDPCAIHVRGPGEYGIGPHGLSWRWHWRKWFKPGGPIRAQENAFHVPEISTVVLFRIWRGTLNRHPRIRTWRKLNAIYAGRIHKHEQDPNKDNRFCALVAEYGVDCRSNPRGKLGATLGTGPYPEQWEWVAEVQETNAT